MNKVIEAIVEFSAKGLENIDAACKRAETSVKNALGGKVPLADQLSNAVDQAHQKIKHKDMFGEMRNQFRDMLTDVFSDVGGPAGSLLGSVIGGAVGGGITAAIGSVIPVIGHLISAGVETAEGKAILAARALNDKEREQIEEAERRSATKTSGLPGGAEAFRAGRGQMVSANVPIEKAEKAMNQIMQLIAGTGHGDPNAMAYAYARMETTHGPRERSAFAKNPEIEDALKNMFPQYKQPGMEQHLDEAISKGRIGTADMEEALRRASTEPRVSQVAEAQKNSPAGVGRSLWETAKESISGGPVAYGKSVREGMKQSFSNWFGGSTKPPGLETGGETGAPWQAHPERMAGQNEYQFTSLVGLAEKMQQEASGGGADVPSQQLTVLQQIEKNTTPKDQDTSPMGHAHAPPLVHGNW